MVKPFDALNTLLVTIYLLIQDVHMDVFLSDGFGHMSLV